VECDVVPAAGTPTATDNCDAAPAVTYLGEVRTNGNCPSNYTLTRTWKATDACGNTSTAEQVITVHDTTAPVLHDVPADATVECDAIPTAATPTATDNCDAAPAVTYLGEVRTNGDCPSNYTLTRTWKATDACGNTSTAQQVITVQDTTPPVINCPANATVEPNNSACKYTVQGNEFNSTATDACGTATMSYELSGASTGSGSDLNGVVLEQGNTIITWKATDACGNTSTCSFTVTVTANNSIISVNCPANITVNAAPALCTATVNIGTATATPGCGATIVSITNNHPSTTFNVGTTIVIWTALDSHGNMATCAQTVVVVDNQPPTISCPGNKQANANAGQCYATGVNLGMPATSDNCGVASLTNDAPLQFPVGTTIVTWTVTDVNGNTATCSQSVLVKDNQNPVISCPANVTVNANNGLCQASSVVLIPATATDNCGIASITNNHPSQVYPVGTTQVVWTATDVNGNSSNCTQLVVVIDNQPPVISCPANITVNSKPNQCFETAIHLDDPVVSDNCGTVSVSNNHPSSKYDVGTTAVIWTATDAHGNTSTCVQYVVVVDVWAPTINCPANKVVNADAGQCQATNVNIGAATAGDNCGIASITNNHPSTTYPVGVTQVIWTATDVNGNTSTCMQTVTVVDNQLPVMTCPSNITVNAASGQCSATVVITPPAATDNCGIASVISNHPSSSYPVGVTTVTWTATDVNGNVKTCSHTVTVLDTQLPTIACPANMVQFTATNGCSKSIAIPDPVANDNCGISTQTWVMSGATSGSSPATGINNVGTRTFNVGVTTIVYTVKDASGNSATCSFTVTLTDNVAPTLSCPADMNVVLNGNNKCSGNVNLPNPTYSDNCGVSALSWTMSGATNGASPLTGINLAGVQSLNVGITTVKYKVTDASGNTSTCQFNVTVTNSKCPNSPPQPIITTITGADISTDRAGDVLKLVAFPNPSDRYFNLRIESGSRDNVVITVFNISGKIMQQLKGSVYENFRFGESFIAGTYVVEVRQGDKKVTTKVIKQ
jgi:hypothetical protein